MRHVTVFSCHAIHHVNRLRPCCAGTFPSSSPSSRPHAPLIHWSPADDGETVGGAITRGGGMFIDREKEKERRERYVGARASSRERVGRRDVEEGKWCRWVIQSWGLPYDELCIHMLEASGTGDKLQHRENDCLTQYAMLHAQNTRAPTKQPQNPRS
jgi:hypothetical protein